MRLHRLTFEAIGPYPGRHTIDFDELSASGLFLLSGPTGSGKSTIIDAVVFALYGTITGAGADGATKERLHSNAAPGATPLVELTFSTSSGIYHVTRTPEHVAPKLRGSGTTTRNATCKLLRLQAPDEIGDPDAGDVLATQVGEAASEIPRIVGLTRDQFTQTMVLPQGRFARFLTARPEDRTSILRGLFGTEIYERLQTALRERARAADAATARACEAAATAARFVVTHLGKPPSVLLDSPLAARGLPPLPDVSGLTDTIAQLSHADLLADTAVAASIDAAVAAARALRTQTSEHAARARQAADAASLARDEQHALARRQKAYDAAAAELTELTARAAEIAAAEASLAAHARALPIVHAGAALTDRGDALNATLDEVTDVATPDDLGDHAAALSERAPREVDAATRWADSRILPDAIVEIRDNLRAVAEQLDADTGRLDSFQRLAAQLDEATQRRDALAAKIRADEASRRACDTQLETIARHRATAARAVEETSVVAETRDAAARGVSAAETRHAAARAAEKYARQIEEENTRFAAASHAHTQASARAAEAQRAWTRQTAGTLAAELTEDCPCPVCGSRDHPAPARPEAESVTSEALRAALDEESSLAARKAASFSRIAALEDTMAAELERCGQRASADTAAALAAAIEKSSRAHAAATRLTELHRELAALDSTAAETTERKRSLHRSQTDDAAEFADTGERAGELRAELAAHLGAHGSIEDLEQDLRRRRDHNRALVRLAERADRLVEQFAADAARLRRELQESGLSSHADAVRHVLAEAEHRTRTEQVTEHRNRLAAARSVVGDAQNAAAHEMAPADPDAADAAFEERRDALDAASALEHGAKAWSETLDHADAERLNRLRSYRATADSLADESRLGRVADGANDRHMTLSTFVVMDMFDTVLVATNERLQDISDGRYSLARSEERESARSHRIGLALTIFDHAVGKTRSLTSLSGGETFYTALSLALGLADTVSQTHGGIEMNTLFIDEGFGSLDSGTLEQVMAVLHGLHETGRAVGVVSHVEEMKQQIADRIDIDKRADDTSTLRVLTSG